MREDVHYTALHKGPGHAISFYPQLFRMFRKVRPAIVHTRNLAALEATVPAWAAGVPARVHGEHGRDVGDLDGSSVRHQWVRRAFSPFVTRYVALSPDLEHYLHDRVGIAANRIEQIYNGVDTTRFRSPPRARSPIEGCPFKGPDCWIVGTVGRMEAVKDQSNLARAFIRAVHLHPEARERMRLVLVGDGALRPQVERILEEAGVRDLAWLPGERADIPDLLRGTRLLRSALAGRRRFEHDTRGHGLGAARRCHAGRGEWRASRGRRMTGRLVPAADSEALARAMVAYFDDPATARRHGRTGRQLVERRFSLDRMVERYHRLYSELLRNRISAASETHATAPGRRTNG